MNHTQRWTKKKNHEPSNIGILLRASLCTIFARAQNTRTSNSSSTSIRADSVFPVVKKTRYPETPKRIIHNACMQSHKYKGEAPTLTVGSRYIMTYGKNIEAGRISRLPEATLEPLLYETYSQKSQGTDKECERDEGYYLFGVPQHTSVSNIGYLFCLSDSLGIDLPDIAAAFARGLRNTDAFKSLLNGKITSHITEDELIHAFSAMSVGAEPACGKIPWNEIAMGLAHRFYRINTVLFDDVRHEISLVLPPYLIDSAKFMDPGRKTLIVERRGSLYYPVYKLNTDVFFRKCSATGLGRPRLINVCNNYRDSRLLRSHAGHPVAFPWKNT